MAHWRKKYKCVAVCCSVLQCVAVCCSVLQCVAVCCSVSQCIAVYRFVLHYVAVRCSLLQCVALCCSVLQCVTVRRSAWGEIRRCSFSETLFFHATNCTPFFPFHEITPLEITPHFNNGSMNLIPFFWFTSCWDTGRMV